MKGFGLVDDIIPEPAGGAHWDYDEAAQILKAHLVKVLSELKDVPQEERINTRIQKFGRMGFWEETAGTDEQAKEEQLNIEGEQPL